MKLIAFESSSGPHMGEIVDDGVKDLGPVDEFYADPPASMRSGRELGRSLAELRRVPPVPRTARIFCVGVNYRSHLLEARAAGIEETEAPVIFGRWPSTLVIDGDPVPIPPNEEGLDWEGELAVVIGRETWCASEEDAMASVLGYTAFNDLSARRKQADTPQWTLGKNADRSGPIGPVLVTAEEIKDPHNLDFSTRVNGQVRQQANTSQMVHRIPRLIAYISDTSTLLPGDVIATGTTAGVGAAMTPPQFLRPEDTVEVEIESIGVLRTPIVRSGQFRSRVPGPGPDRVPA